MASSFVEVEQQLVVDMRALVVHHMVMVEWQKLDKLVVVEVHKELLVVALLKVVLHKEVVVGHHKEIVAFPQVGKQVVVGLHRDLPVALTQAVVVGRVVVVEGDRAVVVVVASLGIGVVAWMEALIQVL